jgi:Skp family chaperone for outer membrane proteins
MTSKFFASAACATLTLWATCASAQQPAPAANPLQAAATAAENSAPSLPGVCVYSQDQTIGASIVGKAVATRLQQLDQQSNAELNDLGTKLQADERALTAQRATMGDAAFQQAAQPLAQREQQLQQLAQVRGREMQATQQQALQTIVQNLDPLLVDIFTAHKCSILIEKSAIVLSSTPMDVTTDAIARLDSKIQSFPFERVKIPEDAGAPAPAPAAAAAPARSTAPAARAPAAAAKPKK